MLQVGMQRAGLWKGQRMENSGGMKERDLHICIRVENHSYTCTKGKCSQMGYVKFQTRWRRKEAPL